MLVGLEMAKENIKIVDSIKKRMKDAQDHLKFYANLHRRDLEFKVGDHVFLRISPIRGMMRFGKSGKFSPWDVGPFKMLRRVGATVYQLVYHRL